MDSSILTAGAIKQVLDGYTPPRPKFQVLSLKKIVSESSTVDRYRLQISDGVHYQPGMLATQMNHKVASGELDKNCVIQVDKMVCNTIQGRKIMILINLTVLHQGSHVGKILGSPTQMDLIKVVPNGHASSLQPPPPVSSNPPAMAPKPFLAAGPGTTYGGIGARPAGGGAFSGASATTPPNRSLMGSSPGARGNIYPIASLNPYQNKWTIRARVISKPTLRQYSNSRGEGQVMSVEFVDESGEIRATGFNEDANRLYPLLQANKVYYVSRGRLRPANKQFSTCKNDYEMMFSRDTEIEECFDIVELPSVSFDFVSISALESAAKDSLVDVIGICSNFYDVTSITTRTTNRQVNKRDITLLDRTGKSVNCTLWGAEAEGFDGSGHPVVAIRGAKVSDFGGVSLSCPGSSVFQLNPDIPEAHQLRGWYDSYGKDQSAVSLSAGSSGGMSRSNVFLTFQQIKELDLGHKEKPDYFCCKGTVTFIRKENLLYQACPSAECNKKVTEDSSGNYFCEKCTRNFPNFKYRMIMKMNVSDFSGNLWLDAFNEQCAVVLGIDAQQLGEMKEKNEQDYNEYIDRALFKSFVFRVRAKIETYNDEQRLRCQCLNVTNIDVVQETRRLLDAIKAMNM